MPFPNITWSNTCEEPQHFKRLSCLKLSCSRLCAQSIRMPFKDARKIKGISANDFDFETTSAFENVASFSGRRHAVSSFTSHNYICRHKLSCQLKNHKSGLISDKEDSFLIDSSQCKEYILLGCFEKGDEQGAEFFGEIDAETVPGFHDNIPAAIEKKLARNRGQTKGLNEKAMRKGLKWHVPYVVENKKMKSPIVSVTHQLVQCLSIEHDLGVCDSRQSFPDLSDDECYLINVKISKPTQPKFKTKEKPKSKKIFKGKILEEADRNKYLPPKQPKKSTNKKEKVNIGLRKPLKKHKTTAKTRSKKPKNIIYDEVDVQNQPLQLIDDPFHLSKEILEPIDKVMKKDDTANELNNVIFAYQTTNPFTDDSNKLLLNHTGNPFIDETSQSLTYQTSKPFVEHITIPYPGKINEKFANQTSKVIIFQTAKPLTEVSGKTDASEPSVDDSKTPGEPSDDVTYDELYVDQNSEPFSDQTNQSIERFLIDKNKLIQPTVSVFADHTNKSLIDETSPSSAVVGHIARLHPNKTKKQFSGKTKKSFKYQTFKPLNNEMNQTYESESFDNYGKTPVKSDTSIGQGEDGQPVLIEVAQVSINPSDSVKHDSGWKNVSRYLKKKLSFKTTLPMKNKSKTKHSIKVVTGSWPNEQEKMKENVKKKKKRSTHFDRELDFDLMDPFELRWRLEAIYELLSNVGDRQHLEDMAIDA
ncbi:hypothetical protein CHUAL_007631 [Chamberlinius hualienensis]